MTKSFPEFKTIEINDFGIFENKTSIFEPYSDFNFTSFYSYNYAKAHKFSLLHDNLVIEIMDYNSGEIFVSFLGNNKMENSIDLLLNYSISAHNKHKLKFVPGACFQDAPNIHKKYKISPDRDNFDYIISSEKISKLSGGDFHSHRNVIKQFVRDCGEIELNQINLRNKNSQSEILELTRDWFAFKHEGEVESQRELEAIKNIFMLSSIKNNIFCIGLYSETKLIAFSIFEILNKNFAIAHFRKADSKYRGAYTYIDHKLGQELANKGIQYINFEQDMGIEGLRKAKEGLAPVRLLEKFTIEKL